MWHPFTLCEHRLWKLSTERPDLAIMSPSEPLGIDGIILALLDLSTSQSEKASKGGGKQFRFRNSSELVFQS